MDTFGKLATGLGLVMFMREQLQQAHASQYDTVRHGIEFIIACPGSGLELDYYRDAELIIRHVTCGLKPCTFVC